MIGVYKITNLVTGDFYIGASNNVARRKSQHFTNKKSGHTQKFDDDILRYGRDAFSVEVIEECRKEELWEREQYYLQTLQPRYNVRWRGCKRSEETKARVSKALTGKKQPRDVVERRKRSIAERHKIHPQTNAGHRKRVMANGIVFASIKACAEYLGVSPSTVTHAMKKGHKVKGHEVRFVV